MRALPRPWRTEVYDGDVWWISERIVDAEGHKVAWTAKEGIAEIVNHAVNAFDALLAVAKAAHLTPHHRHGEPATHCGLCEALDLLEHLHPGWREWGEQ